MKIPGAKSGSLFCRSARKAATLAFLTALSASLPALADDDRAVPGATLASVLTVARKLSPSLKEAALETDAASARADRADALDDPTLTSSTMQVPSGALMDQTQIMLEQDFPLWGKRDLRKSAALALLDAARGQERATTAELEEKIKVAFARYYAASQALLINNDVARIADQMYHAALGRYSQAAGSQADALEAQAETTNAGIEKLRLDAERRSAAADLNALLGRPADTPLAEPEALKTLPDKLPPIATLVDKARAANPILFQQDALLRSAEAQQELARKSWYPDVTLGAGSERNAGSWGVAAMVGIKVPLQWGAKESAEREADANYGAAQERIATSTLEIESELSQALAKLDAAQSIAAMRHNQLVPQLNAAYKSAVAEYASGHGDLMSTLTAVHRLHDNELELLKIEVEGQTALAMIERLTGGDL